MRILVTLALMPVIAVANVAPVKPFNFEKLEPAKIVELVCSKPDVEKVVACVATYDNAATKRWWMKETEGVVYRYDEYPAPGIDPVPFRR